MIVSRFALDRTSNPTHFSDDIPFHLFSILEEYIFDKLINAKNFSNKKVLRDEAQILFEAIFKPWKGELTEITKRNVKTKINYADAAGRNRIFDWNINVVSPALKEQAYMEQ